MVLVVYNRATESDRAMSSLPEGPTTLYNLEEEYYLNKITTMTDSFIVQLIYVIHPYTHLIIHASLHIKQSTQRYNQQK
jgi:hypothetical protein